MTTTTSAAAGLRVLRFTARLGAVLAVLLALGVASLVALGAQVSAQTMSPTPRYVVVDLGTWGSSSYAQGINESSQVVGYAASYNYYSFLYDGNAATKVKSLLDSSYAHSINESGQVVGYTNGSQYSRAFLYDENAATKTRDLGTLGGNTSQAFAINDSGKVVGTSDNGTSGYLRPFLYDENAATKMKDLGTLGGNYGFARDINNSDQIVGSAVTTDGPERAFLYDENTATKMKDLGTLGGGNYSWATGINDSGQVVGHSYTSGGGVFGIHAFLYDENATTKMKDLGTLWGGNYSYAYGINSSGQVVGYSYTSGNASKRAFLYKDGQITDLNELIPADSGWVLHNAYEINDYGQIVGVGEKNGYERAFLLTPPETTKPVTTATTALSQSNAAGWNNTDVLVELKATDNAGGSGVKEITYSATGAQQLASKTTQGSSASVSISTEGETTITYSATDNAGNAEDEQTFTVKLDKTAPDAVSGLSAAPGNAKADLSWTNPTASNLDKVRILRSTSGPANSPEPGDGQSQVYEGTDTSYSDTGLTNATMYYYTVFARDAAGNWSSASSVSATPKAPDTLNPSVSTTTPTKKTGVSRNNSGITATFSEPVDKATVEGIDPTTLKPNVQLINTATKKPVAATVSCDADPCNKVTITPKKALAANTKHKATVTTGVKDPAGNLLDQNPTTAGTQPKNWTFTTGRR